eukprot:symbB.v1.2.001338.t1/scaffold73.1/size366217/2
MAEVVVARPETIFIGTASRFAKGVEHVWQYKLTFVGAQRMYVCMEPPSTTHAGDLMFIMEEVVDGNKWFVAYEGRPVPNAEGEQELEKRAAVFRTSASFWEDGVHEWETNDVRSRATYTEEVKEPQWQARGGVLTLDPKKGGRPTKMLFQKMAAAPGASHVRLNCTIRWHDTHFEGCPAIRRFKPAVAGEDQLSDSWAVDEPLYSVVGVTSSGQFAGIKLLERAGTEQVQADRNVAAASSSEFAGIKLSERAGAQQVQAVDHRCGNLHDKEVQVGQSLSDVVQTLLACLDQCVQQSELFTLVLHSVPWAVQAAIHEGTLRSLAASVEQLRKQLLAASEAVADLGND